MSPKDRTTAAIYSYRILHTPYVFTDAPVVHPVQRSAMRSWTREVWSTCVRWSRTW